jgi:hypothetical protein
VTRFGVSDHLCGVETLLLSPQQKLVKRRAVKRSCEKTYLH